MGAALRLPAICDELSPAAVGSSCPSASERSETFPGQTGVADPRPWLLYGRYLAARRTSPAPDNDPLDGAERLSHRRRPFAHRYRADGDVRCLARLLLGVAASRHPRRDLALRGGDGEDERAGHHRPARHHQSWFHPAPHLRNVYLEDRIGRRVPERPRPALELRDPRDPRHRRLVRIFRDDCRAFAFSRCHSTSPKQFRKTLTRRRQLLLFSAAPNLDRLHAIGNVNAAVLETFTFE